MPQTNLVPELAPRSVTFPVTITNHWSTRCKDHDGERHDYVYGIPVSMFPEPYAPGMRFKVTIAFDGMDPKVQPELHGFLPRGADCTRSCVEPKIREAKAKLKSGRTEDYSRPWWRKRLENLQERLQEIAEGERLFRRINRIWRKAMKKRSQ